MFARCELKSINTLRHKGNVAIDVAINHEPFHKCTWNEKWDQGKNNLPTITENLLWKVNLWIWDLKPLRKMTWV